MASPLPDIIICWLEEGGCTVAEAGTVEILMEEMIRRQDFLPLELMAARAGFCLFRDPKAKTSQAAYKDGEGNSGMGMAHGF